MDDLIEEPEEESENVGIVMSMGFSQKKAKIALDKCGNDVERAIDYLFSHEIDENEELN